MRIHLINPSHVSFGVAVITPRWLFVLAAATPPQYGDPILTDETLEPIEPGRIAPGDIVGIGIHTGNALRGYEIGRLARERGAKVVYGGIHATLFPEEAHERGGAHSVVKGDGDVVWRQVLADCANLLPPWRNIPRLARSGIDLLAISGGKHMRGPQCAGMFENQGGSTRHVVGPARAVPQAHADLLRCLTAEEFVEQAQGQARGFTRESTC